VADHTFLLADLSGFTALTEAHGDEEAADLAAVFYAEAARCSPSTAARN
jgi:adenylate cyclase